MKKPLHVFLIAAILLVGVTIGLVFDAGSLERFLEPILAYLAGPGEPRLYLVPVDFDPFDQCSWEKPSPHDLCV